MFYCSVSETGSSHVGHEWPGFCYIELVDLKLEATLRSLSSEECGQRIRDVAFTFSRIILFPKPVPWDRQDGILRGLASKMKAPALCYGVVIALATALWIHKQSYL